MAYPGLNKTETSEMAMMMEEIKLDQNSDKSKEYREEIFFGRKKVARIRYFLDSAPGVKLTDDEIKEIRKKYLNSKKSADWTIARDLIKYQRQLSGKEVMGIYNSLSEMNRISITQTVLGDSRITDKDRKELIDVLFNHGNYHYHVSLLGFVNNELLNYKVADIWKDTMRKIVDEVNSGSPKGQTFLDNWESEITVANYILDELELSSLALYELTGNETFLPKEAKDIFLF
jgi:serine/threonine protein phosphatase PrpC